MGIGGEHGPKPVEPEGVGQGQVEQHAVGPGKAGQGVGYRHRPLEFDLEVGLREQLLDGAVRGE